MIMRFLFPFISSSLILLLNVPTASANTPEQIFVQISPSVVVVNVLDDKGKYIGLGSGTVIGVGQIITNCHVVQKGKILQVRQSDKIFMATLQFADPDRDLCQLSVPDLQAPPVALGSAEKLRIGQRVYAVGAPQGMELTLSEGLVSGLRQYEGSQYIQTSAAISSGSSGGGLFDEQGRLIGITTFYLTEGQNLNFALPVDWIGEISKRAQAVPVLAKKNVLEWLNSALAFEQKNEWQGLLKLTQQWVISEPDNAIAWGVMGEAYYGLKQYSQAVDCYHKAAEQGEVGAQFSLGMMYAKGQGVTKDDRQAVDWFRKSAEQGYANAQSSLSFMYATGQGVTQNDLQALNWVRKAAEQGNATAQLNLGFMYDTGTGVPQDPRQAVDWYRKAAEQGHAGAQFNMGVILAEGQGITQNYRQAAVWYRKAAEQGFSDAQFNLGLMYEKGQGVTQDYIEAHKWFNISGAGGDSNGKKNRERLAKKMTSKQISEAQHRASSWMEKHH